MPSLFSHLERNRSWLEGQIASTDSEAETKTKEKTKPKVGARKKTMSCNQIMLTDASVKEIEESNCQLMISGEEKSDSTQHSNIPSIYLDELDEDDESHEFEF